MKKVYYVIFLIGLAGLITSAIVNRASLPRKTTPISAPAAPTHLDTIRSFKNGLYDGQYLKANRAIKSVCRDPKSFEHISTSILYNRRTVDVIVTYRARNGFNGYAIDTQKLTYTYDGNLVN